MRVDDTFEECFTSFRITILVLQLGKPANGFQVFSFLKTLKATRQELSRLFKFTSLQEELAEQSPHLGTLTKLLTCPLVLLLCFLLWGSATCFTMGTENYSHLDLVRLLKN